MSENAKLTYGGVLCGGCQQWGADPHLRGNRCTTCDRTREKIAADHGIVELSERHRARLEELRRTNPRAVPRIIHLSEPAPT